MIRTSPYPQEVPLKKAIFRSSVFQLTVFLSTIFLIIAGSFIYKNVYRKQRIETQQTAFDRFLDELFIDELESDSLSLHFLLEDASAYGIEASTPSLTPYSPDKEEQYKNKLLEQRNTLTSFSFDKLTPEQQQTYECLLFLLDNSIALSQYSELSNPVSPHSGIQQQLPFLLSEYRFDSRSDMEDYLALLDSVYAYFEGLCTVMQNHFAKNTIPAIAFQNAARQCASFLSTPLEENILLASFSDRLSGLEYLDEVEYAIYEMKNRYRIETEILPAYRMLYETLSATAQSLPPDTSNSSGLSAHKDGREYYTLLAQKAASSDMTVPKMKEMLEQYYHTALTHMRSLAKQDPDLPQLALDRVSSDGTPLYAAVQGRTSSDILRFLQQNSLQLLPSLSQSGSLHVTLKTTSPCLQEMSAPAMYLLSPLDAYLEHTVYLNPAYSGSNSYSTIAHETFPGHLTARVCFLSGNPHPVRALTDFIGWDEGWASLAELYAYGFLSDAGGASSSSVPTPIPANRTSQNTDPVLQFLCSYEIASLCLYGLTDIGVHYDGWSRQDTICFWQEHGVETSSADALWELVVSEPAYYLPYSMGLIQMLELRKLSISALGDTYTEPAFCSALLSLGPMPYFLCEKYLLQR